MARRRQVDAARIVAKPPSVRDGTETTVTATEAQLHFGQIVDRALQDDVVVITRHNQPRVVLVSFDRYTALVSAKASALDTLNDEFDHLLANMQRPAARAAMHDAYGASSAQLGRAAVTEAKTRRR